jgi:hypothetical protein
LRGQLAVALNLAGRGGACGPTPGGTGVAAPETPAPRALAPSAPPPAVDATHIAALAALFAQSGAGLTGPHAALAAALAAAGAGPAALLAALGLPSGVNMAPTPAPGARRG